MTLRRHCDPPGRTAARCRTPRTRSPEPRLRGALRAPLGAPDHRGQAPSPTTEEPLAPPARSPPAPPRRGGPPPGAVPHERGALSPACAEPPGPLLGGSTTTGRRPQLRTAPRRAVRSGAGDETHAALVGLRDLDVGDPVDRDDDTTTPLVDQGQQAVLGRAGHGCGDIRSDLVRGLGTVDDQLPGGVLNTDLDFHVGDASSVRATGPNASPAAASPARRAGAPSANGAGGHCGGCAPSTRGKPELPRQARADMRETASARDTVPFRGSHQRALVSARPVSPEASRRARSGSAPVSAAMIPAMASTQTPVPRSTIARTSASLRRSDSKTRRKASPSASMKSK